MKYFIRKLDLDLKTPIVPVELVSSTETGVLSRYVALTEEDKVVGHVAVKLPGDHLRLALTSAGLDTSKVVEACQLSVSERFRGLKIGSSLLEHAENEALRTSKALGLMVYGWNSTAISLYGRRGYSEIGRFDSPKGLLLAFILDD